MSKVTYKLKPGDYWLIGEYESWLSEMASQGYHLEKLGAVFGKFSKGEPKKMRYRIDFAQGRGVARDQLEVYSESGWDYVTSYREIHIFSSPVSLNAPELHTDPAEQSYTLSYLNRKLTMGAVLVTAMILFMMGFFWAMWFLDPTPYLSMVADNVTQQIVLTLVIFYSGYSSLQSAAAISRLKKTLSEGKTINHAAQWRNKRRMNIIVFTIFTSLAVFAVVLPVIRIVSREVKTLPAASSNLPIVMLAEVEQNASIKRETSYIHNNVDWGNHYSYYWSLFSPYQYRSSEKGIISRETSEDKNNTYTASLHSEVYQIRFSAVSERVVLDLVKRDERRNDDGHFREVEHSGFDKLIIHETDSLKEIYGSRGKVVMHVSYSGQAELEAVIEAAARKIDLISN